MALAKSKQEDWPSELKRYNIDYVQNLNYVHRWAIQKTEIPESVRLRVAAWFKSDIDLSRLYEPLIQALELNNPTIILKECL